MSVATTTTTVSSPVSTRTANTVIVASAAVAVFWIAFGAHTWSEIISSAAFLAVVTAVLTVFVVPRALRKESAGGTALALSIPALLLTFPAFWSGLPVVLGTAGLLVGAAGRTARTGAGKCIVAVALGALAVAGYLAIYVLDGVVAGHSGFLFD